MTSDLRLSVPGDIPALRRLWQEAFGDGDEFLDLFFAAAYSPERCMTVWQGGTLTGAAYWFGCELGGLRLAYVYAVAVSKVCRGQGLGKGLMKGLESHLKSRGFDGVLLVPGEESLRRFYGAMGYATVSRHSRLTVSAGAPVPVEELTPGEYAAARREMLPEKGVIQEGENLSFLAGMAKLYRGEGFLAAVTEEGCPEFLGDGTKAPGLAAKLGRQHLSIRIPGAVTPYAMGKSLTSEALPEGLYFGFGFD